MTPTVPNQLPPDLYPHLLSPWKRGRLQLRNRIVHPAMTTRMIFEQVPTEGMVQYYANRAMGGAAMVVTEPLNSHRFQTRGHYVRVWNDDNYDWLRKWAAAVESHDCRLLGQIQDSGRGRHERGRNPNAIGVCALPDDLSWTVPRTLTRDELLTIVEDFGRSSARLERAGFSGVELSAGHGHLFHQFMSRRSNQRTDEFGGELNARMKFLTSTVEAVRSFCSNRFIVGVKLPGDDGMEDGIDPSESAAIVEALTRKDQVDYVTFCQGAHSRTLDWHIPDMHWPRSTWMSLIRKLRQHANGVPVMALGLITDPAEADGIIARDECELVGVGRALITDPAWPLKAASGREREIRYCVSCNTCWGQIVAGAPLSCDNNPRVALADEVDWKPPAAKRKRRVVIVGAGVAGLEAAWTAAAQGHDVTVFGANAEVGGSTRLHALLPGGEALSSVYDYQYTRARACGVRFELGITAQVADVVTLKPEQVILAAGASMVWPYGLPAQWREDGALIDARTAARELQSYREKQGGTAVLFDMDHTEGTYALAEVFARLFDRTVIVTPRERIAADVPLVTNLGIYRRMTRKRIEIVPLSELSRESLLEDARIAYANVHTGDVAFIEDVAIAAYSTPRVPRIELLAGLLESGVPVEAIGDCKVPRTLLAATSEGYTTGMKISSRESRYSP